MTKVITYDDQRLANACLELQGRCPTPDLVIGIARGGVYVARQMFAERPHVYVARQRPTTRAKDKSHLSRLIGKLPYRLLDLARIAEHKMLTAKKVNPDKVHLKKVTFSPETSVQIASCRSVLIVDDAVDSGATLTSVKDAVKALSPEAQVMTAAVTVTTDTPLTMPDYYIYHNHTLIRFPWSTDYKHPAD